MKKLFLGVIAVITFAIFWINFKLYSGNDTAEEEKVDVIKQLNFLENELKNKNLGERMQQVFPEGFVFTNVLYGLSWCELANSGLIADKKLKEKALKEALFAYNEIASENARVIFEPDLNPRYGIYYVGWKNYLLSKILQIDTTFDAKYITLFSAECERISGALNERESPFLESYYKQCWPADMCIAMASMSNHDKIFTPKYQTQINEWISKVRNRLDLTTKMMPHKVSAISGKTIEGTRGSSISLIVRMLIEIDSHFANEQYQLYKTNFVSTTFGLPSVCEYPKGQNGDSDVDSGPVIFGVGFSGTIVSIGTFALLGNYEQAQQQYATINAFGFEYETENEKKYVFGSLPIADAFIAWGRASAIKNHTLRKLNLSLWRIPFHLISVFILAVLWGVYLFFAKKNAGNQKLLR